MPADRSTPVFVYDGDCSFCTSCARFVERRIPTRATVAAWQHLDLTELGITTEQAEAAVQWVPAAAEADGRRPGSVKAGPEAIARLLVDAGSYWKPMGVILGLPPVRLLAWPVYRLIARNRHRMPGGTAACSLPQAERDDLNRAGPPR